MSSEYWYCIIGPIDRSKVPFGGDFPLRQAVKGAFSNMLGEDADSCSSGWGMDQEEMEEIREVQHKHFLKRINNNGTVR